MKPLALLNLNDLAEICRRDVSDLEALATGRLSAYTEAQIVTDSGKERVLHKPSYALKVVQKRILRGVFGKLTPHAASACVKKRGTHWAYRRHAGHPYIIGFDIADFFPSVGEEKVTEGLIRLGAREDVADILTHLVTLPAVLPQGAPTSVAVSDVVLFGLDIRLHGLANSRGAGFTYTRYVDDITFSGGERLAQLRPHIESIITEDWKLNDKTVPAGPGERHSLLGAVVNTKPNVSREYFRDVRSLLRQIASRRVDPSEEQFRSVESQVGWIVSVNPERVRVLGPLLRRASEVASHPLVIRLPDDQSSTLEVAGS